MKKAQSITEFVKEVKKESISVTEHTEKIIEEAEKSNSQFHHFNLIAKKSALQHAKEIDAGIKTGQHKGKLLGVPISVKDCICVKDFESRAGSKILSGYLPLFDATAIAKAKAEGAIIIGKTAQDEFGFGTFSNNVGVDFEKPLNPLDPKRCCGGSSGGSAGFTALTSLTHASLGQSTGGSIAAPASFCGVAGLTPTYGRVSRYGFIDYASSMDKIGVMSKKIRKCAEVLEIISGKDDKDATCIDMPKGFVDYLGKDCSNLRVGIIKQGFNKGVDTKIVKCVKDAIKKLGLNTKEVDLSFISKYSLPVYYLLAMTEASTNLAKLCGLRYGVEEDNNMLYNDYFTKIRSDNFNQESKRRIIIGTFARMAGFRNAYYLKAAKIRTLIINKYKELFKEFDVLICPTMPIIAPTFEEAKKLTPLQNYMMDILTVGPNLAGLPHLNVPCGFVNKMPVGMLFIADHFNEKVLIQLGDYYENRT